MQPRVQGSVARRREGLPTLGKQHLRTDTDSDLSQTRAGVVVPQASCTVPTLYVQNRLICA